MLTKLIRYFRRRKFVKRLNKLFGTSNKVWWIKPEHKKPCWLHQYDMTFGHLLHFSKHYTTDGITQRTCSSCHACSYMLKDHPPYKYCPRCGKRMHDVN